MPNPRDAVHTYCHCLPQMWHQMSVILSAASSLSWLGAVTGKSAGELTLAAESVDPRDAPLFLPYLNGERTPHNDPHARGVFFDMSSATGIAELAYGVMEGVAFAMADGHAALSKAGNRLTEASFVGGGSRSAFWARICAAATGLTLHNHGDGEVGGAFGAARLARLAVTGQAISQVCVPPPITRSVEPDAALRELLLTRWERYQRLYAVLKPEFTREA
jgi:xylulokinase